MEITHIENSLKWLARAPRAASVACMEPALRFELELRMGNKVVDDDIQTHALDGTHYVHDEARDKAMWEAFADYSSGRIPVKADGTKCGDPEKDAGVVEVYGKRLVMRDALFGEDGLLDGQFVADKGMNGRYNIGRAELVRSVNAQLTKLKDEILLLRTEHTTKSRVLLDDDWD